MMPLELLVSDATVTISSTALDSSNMILKASSEDLNAFTVKVRPLTGQFTNRISK